MRALVQTGFGSPSDAKVLSVQYIPKPVLAANSSDVLVRIKCASMAPAEYNFFSGLVTRVLGISTIPAVSGVDFAGVVEQVGEEAKAQGWKEGDEVLGCVAITRKGTYQEYIVVSCSLCARRPPNVSWEEASCLPANGMTALQALENHQGAKEAAFVTGGLGGVGLLAIQLLHHRMGFKKIITSVSTSKVAQFKELYPYVDEVIDYKTTNPTSVVPKSSLDLVFSTIGAPGPWMPYLVLQRPTPTLIEITTSPGSAILESEAHWGVRLPWYTRIIFDLSAWWMRPNLPRGVKFVAHNTAFVQRDLEAVASEAGKGHLTPLVGKVFTLEQGAEAFELCHKGIVGKVVFRVTE